MSVQKKILFITQDLGRTGSEVVLWHLLQHLNPESYLVHVFCLRKGVLYEALPADVGKSVMYQNSPKKSDRFFRRVLKKMKINALDYQLGNLQKKIKADIWFVNTIVIPEVYEIAKKYNVKVATYVHELLYAFTFITGGAMQKVLTYSDVCIGCSEEVCERIIEMGHKNVRLQHSFTDTDLIISDRMRVASLRKELGFRTTDFVWVVSGKTTYMKGLDYMIPILEYFKDQPVKILWVGGNEDTGLRFYVQQVVEEKYPGKLVFVGSQSEDYYNYLSLSNGLLLPSREESFSLVLVEAAKLGLPVVSFDLGIAGKFIKLDMGRVVKNRNVEELIAQMEYVQRNNFDTVKMMDAALEYSVQHQIPRFEKLLAELFNG